MEDNSFDISGLLTDEEAEKLFEEKPDEQEETPEQPEEQEEIEPADEEEVEPSQEEVGKEDEKPEDDAADLQDGGSSPETLYSSIANALKKDGIFPDFTDEEISAVKSPDDFAEMFEKAVTSRMDERVRRVDEALGNGVAPDTVKMYEQTIQYLHSINEEALSAEGDEAEDLRKQIIYNDLINRGYDQDKANRVIENSFKAGSDVDDAKDALKALTAFYEAGYKKVQDEAKAKVEAAKKAQMAEAKKFQKLVLEDEVKLGDTVLDKKTCQKVFDAVNKPVFKDPDTGKLLTAVQQFQKESPLEFLKQLGIWYVLTNGGKNLEGLVQKQLRAEKNKGVRELEKKINASSFNTDGSIRYAGSSEEGGGDPLLSDGWRIG